MKELRQIAEEAIKNHEISYQLAADIFILRFNAMYPVGTFARNTAIAGMYHFLKDEFSETQAIWLTSCIMPEWEPKSV